MPDQLLSSKPNLTTATAHFLQKVGLPGNFYFSYGSKTGLPVFRRSGQ